MSTTKQEIQCPYCGAHFVVEKDWIIQNGRVFCGTCCKAFDVSLEKEDPSNYFGEFYD
jgi:predicted Zn finger-like uncharacterized protein